MKPSAADAEPITHNYVDIGTTYFWDETGSFSAEPERCKPMRSSAQATVRKATPAVLARRSPGHSAAGIPTNEARRPR